MLVRQCRVVFVVSLALVLSVSSTEAPADDNLSPQELNNDANLGESTNVNGPVETVPLAVVSAFSNKIEAENKHLMAENAALRTQNKVDEAKQEVAVAGGLMKPEKTEDKPKSPAEAQATAVPPAAELPPAMKKGMKVMNEYQATIKKLQAKVGQEAAKIDSMKQHRAEEKIQQEEQVVQAKAESEADPPDYHRVPFFKFSAGSKELTDIPDQRACQDVCDKQSKCKSYSWSTSGKTCVWSVDAVNYDPKFVFLVKAQIGTAGDPAASWREFPGIKYITAHTKEKTNLEFEQCKSLCENDITCKSFSYRGDRKFCAYSGYGVSYDQHFNYFEKEKTKANKVVEKKEEKLKNAEEKLKHDMSASQKKEQDERDKEQKENDIKKQERNRWLANQPTNSQEAHLKMTVSMEMKSMDAKFAMQNSKKKEEVEKKAESEFEKKQIAAVSKMSFLEAEMHKAEAKKKEEAKKIDPLEQAKSLVEVAIAKLNAKIKMLDVDRKLKDVAVTNAEQALAAARKSQDAAAITTTTNGYNDAKRAVVQNEEEKGKLIEQVAVQKDALKTKSAALKTAQDEEKKFKVELKAEEAKNKDVVKQEKALLEKQKMVMTVDKEKADTAKLVALKAKEKMAKSKRANAKVIIFKAENSMANITTAEERRESEERLADARGQLFKADKDNGDLTTALVDTAKQLAQTKEFLHKAKTKVEATKKKDERQNVENKLTQLESEAAKAP